MGRPGTIETIDMLSDLVPVIGHRLASGYLEILSEMIVGIASHPVCSLGVIISLIRSVTLEQMSTPWGVSLVRVGVLQRVEILSQLVKISVQCPLPKVRPSGLGGKMPVASGLSSGKGGGRRVVIGALIRGRDPSSPCSRESGMLG